MQLGELQIVPTESPGALRLDWIGRSTERRPEVTLGPFLNEQLVRARVSRATLEINLEALDFFNSATITVILDYLQRLREAKVPVRVSYAIRHRWQRIFFDAIRIFEAKGVLELNQIR